MTKQRYAFKRNDKTKVCLQIQMTKQRYAFYTNSTANVTLMHLSSRCHLASASVVESPEQFLIRNTCCSYFSSIFIILMYLKGLLESLLL